MQGKTGAEAFNGVLKYGGDAGRYSAQVTNAFLGTQQRDLSRLVAGAGRTFGAFASREADLQGLIDNFNVFTGALAAQSTNLSTTIALAAPTLRTARASLVSLNRALPPLRTYAIELTPAVAELPGLISASKPWLAQVRPLLSGKEGGGVARLLAESTPGLAGAAQAGKEVTLPQLNRLSLCTTKVFVPTGNQTIERSLQHRRPQLPRVPLHPRQLRRPRPELRRQRPLRPRQRRRRPGPGRRTEPAGQQEHVQRPDQLRPHDRAADRQPAPAQGHGAAEAGRSLLHQPRLRRERRARPGRRPVALARGGEPVTAPTPPSSRWRHFRAWLSRQSRGHRKDTIAIVVLAIAGIVMMLGIFTQQKASLPSWLPLVGEEFDHITAEFATAQAVTPGQGQSVDIAGIQIGKVTSVDLEDGHAVVGMDIVPEYMELIHPNATLLLRPKTGLNDMIVEVSPGSGEKSIESGANFTLAQTEPNTNLDAFLATLDGDTRQYLQLLVAGGAQGIGGRGKQLSNALRRFQPFVHYTAKLNKAVAARHVALANVIHDFGLLTTELGRHDAEIKRFVTSSDAALGNFANQQQAIQESLREFPAALRAGNAGLASSKRFSDVAYPALTALIPQAQALTPAFKATERMFSQTTAPIRDQIRPFTRQIRPVLTHANEASGPFNKTVRSFGNALGGFNPFLNELAYKPKGSRESCLFYLAWLNHDFNAVLQPPGRRRPDPAGHDR